MEADSESISIRAPVTMDDEEVEKSSFGELEEYSERQIIDDDDEEEFFDSATERLTEVGSPLVNSNLTVNSAPQPNFSVVSTTVAGPPPRVCSATYSGSESVTSEDDDESVNRGDSSEEDNKGGRPFAKVSGEVDEEFGVGIEDGEKDLDEEQGFGVAKVPSFGRDFRAHAAATMEMEDGSAVIDSGKEKEKEIVSDMQEKGVDLTANSGDGSSGENVVLSSGDSAVPEISQESDFGGGKSDSGDRGDDGADCKSRVLVMDAAEMGQDGSQEKEKEEEEGSSSVQNMLHEHDSSIISSFGADDKANQSGFVATAIPGVAEETSDGDSSSLTAVDKPAQVESFSAQDSSTKTAKEHLGTVGVQSDHVVEHACQDINSESALDGEPADPEEIKAKCVSDGINVVDERIQYVVLDPEKKKEEKDNIDAKDAAVGDDSKKPLNDDGSGVSERQGETLHEPQKDADDGVFPDVFESPQESREDERNPADALQSKPDEAIQVSVPETDASKKDAELVPIQSSVVRGFVPETDASKIEAVESVLESDLSKTEPESGLGLVQSDKDILEKHLDTMVTKDDEKEDEVKPVIMQEGQDQEEKEEEEQVKPLIKEDTVATAEKPAAFFRFDPLLAENRSILQRMVEEWEGAEAGEEEEDEEDAADHEQDDEEEEEEEEEMVDPSAIAALMEAAAAAAASSGRSVVSSNPLVSRPGGLGSTSLEPLPRVIQRSSALVANEDQNDGSNGEIDETEQKLQMIRVKFLRLVKRLGQTPQNAIVTQVLYRLGLAEGIKRGGNSSRAFSLERASMIAESLEAAGKDDLDFTCNILVLGKTGVGKSATINSIFDEVKTETSPFEATTDKVKEISGKIQGIDVRIIDTPGLLTAKDDRQNRRIMSSVKKFIGKQAPDIVLYFDRLDVQSRDYSDLPLLKIITETFGASIWFNAIIVLTHGASAPPDGPNGVPLSYEIFVAQRSHVVQHSIRQAAGDLRLMNPVSTVENHSACRRNRQDERVLPNGQAWKPQLLLLCFASKVLAEANALLKLQDTTPGKSSVYRNRVPQLAFLLSSLLQSHPPPKLPYEQYDDEEMMDSDGELDDVSDIESEDEFDLLPPFRQLSKSELSQLDSKQRKAYYEELDQREQMFMKKQWKDELRRRKYIKKNKAQFEESQTAQEDPSQVAMPMPDLALPLSFDADNPTYRYRGLDSQYVVRPVLDTHGWDHDVGYDGVNVEKTFAVQNKIPVQISGQITKDKKDLSLQFESAASVKHGEHTVSQAGVYIHTIGRDLSYTLRADSRFSNFKLNKTSLGLALTKMGETLAYGMKLEDKLTFGRRGKVVVSGGAMMGKKHVAYGGSLELALNKEFGQPFSSLSFNVMNWHGDLAIGGTFQSQFNVGRKNVMVVRGNLNNRNSGQVSMRFCSNEHLELALIGAVPIIRTIWQWLRSESNMAE